MGESEHHRSVWRLKVPGEEGLMDTSIGSSAGSSGLHMQKRMYHLGRSSVEEEGEANDLTHGLKRSGKGGGAWCACGYVEGVDGCSRGW